MPPILNTYGTRKKKRRGIPKCILKNTDNVFEALKIDNFKETKAIIDAKLKAREKKKGPAPLKVEPLLISSDTADDTFDRLLREGPINSCAPDVCSDSSHSSINVSSLPEMHQRDLKQFSDGLKDRCSKKLQMVMKKSVKANRLKRNLNKLGKAKNSCAVKNSFFHSHSDTSLFQLEESQLLRENLVFGNEAGAEISVSSAKSICTTPVLRERNVRLLPISPILPLPPLRGGSSSTPCEKVSVKSFNISPELKSQNMSDACDPGDEVFPDRENNGTIPFLCQSVLDQNGLEDKVNQKSENNGSIDMFVSWDQKEPEGEVNQKSENNGSIDMFVSWDQKEPEGEVNQKSEINGSFDMFTSFDQEEFSNSELNEGVNCVATVDLHENCAKPIDCGTTISSTNKDCEASRSICVCESSNVSSVQIINSSEVDNLITFVEDIVLSSSNEDSNDDFLVNRNEVAQNSRSVHCEDPCVNMKDVQIVHNKCASAPNQLSLLSMSFQESVSLSDLDSASVETVGCCGKLQDTYSPPYHEGVKMVEKAKAIEDNCFVLLTRCEIPTSSEDSCPFGGVCDDSLTNEVAEFQRNNGEYTPVCDTAACHGSELLPRAREVSKHDVYYGKVAFEGRECKVVLSRCDDLLSRRSSLNTELKYPLEDTLSNEIISRNFPERDSSVSNRRSDSNVDSLVLKPGKQWRRSLSILSKVRTSGDESSTSNRQSVAVSNKLKGKRWGLSISSLIQLQSARETILEDWEESLGSLSVELNSSRRSIEQLSQDESVICQVPKRVSLESDASQVYRRCFQEGPLPFSKFFPANMKKNCEKIGEGVYGEVFLFSGSAHRAPSVIKIIPIEGEMEVNGEPQKTYGEILSEVVVVQELSNLRKGVFNATRTFNEVQAIRCVQGSYPDWLQTLWHDFDNVKGSENDSPEIFQENQLYIVLELSNGGKDLESFVFSSADQGLAAFKQVALALAVAEEAVEFEHRDLHWGNVLISNTKEKEVNYTLNGETLCTATKGVEVSIIDFTLSRITDPASGKPIFYDLARDETLFTAQGDYQFDIYRMMKESNGNKWDTFVPRSNIAWLHYLLDKLCTVARYKNRSTKVHKRAIALLLELRDSVLMFNNVSTFVKCDGFSK